MFRPILDPIIDELNPGLCRRDIAAHWACRCTVPGPGMRAAGEILVRRYLENGAASAELIPYPADDRTVFLGSRNQLEWRPYGASLSVAGPTGYTICRYDDEPLCLTCYSVATPPEGLEAEVVEQHGPLAPEAVTEGQWAGKIIFTDQFPWTVADAIGKSGAVGMISDCVSPPWLAQHPPVREPEDVPDLTMWTIFSGRRDQPQLFGFNLSPRQGRRLRDLIRSSAEPVRLRAIVQAETVEGSSDFVHATLPGTDLADEEIWVLAHLSEPGARDNASGCCLSVEWVRTLKTLIDAGKLPPLRRTIRFMHGVEVSGFLPYLEANQSCWPQVKAGLCADSFAENPSRCGGEIVLFLAPEANASFVDGLWKTLLTAMAKEPVTRFTPDNYMIFPWHTEPFFGNDAFVSGGLFDIPAPQLSAWPDKQYHSNLDIPEDIDEGSLKRMGSLGATYLYLLATAGAPEARWFAALAAQDFKGRISECVSETVTAVDLPLDDDAARRLADQVWHLGLQGQDAVTQTLRFAPADEALAGTVAALRADLEAFARREAEQVVKLYSTGGSVFTPAAPAECEGAALIARAKVWSPQGVDALARRVYPWVNGRRSALQIAERLQFSGAVSLSEVVTALRALAEAGAVEFLPL